MALALTDRGVRAVAASRGRYNQLIAEGYTHQNAFDRVAYEQGNVHGEIHVLANSGNEPDWDALVRANLAKRG